MDETKHDLCHAVHSQGFQPIEWPDVWMFQRLIQLIRNEESLV